MADHHDGDGVWKTYPFHQRLLFTVVGIDWWGIGEALADEKKQAGPRPGSFSKLEKTEYVLMIVSNVKRCKGHMALIIASYFLSNE